MWVRAATRWRAFRPVGRSGTTNFAIPCAPTGKATKARWRKWPAGFPARATSSTNAANGEDNRDGTDNNPSWNHGVEGPTADPAITALRERQKRNLLATLLLS